MSVKLLGDPATLHLSLGVAATQFEFTSRTEPIDVSTAHDWQPDMNWSAVDQAGHFHTFADGGELPTLKQTTERHDCGCEICLSDGGYDVDVYTCKICAERVRPIWRDLGPRHATTPGLTHSTIRLRAAEFPCGIGDRLTFRIELGAGGVVFGIARVLDLSFGSEFSALLDVEAVGRRSQTLAVTP